MRLIWLEYIYIYRIQSAIAHRPIKFYVTLADPISCQEREREREREREWSILHIRHYYPHTLKLFFYNLMALLLIFSSLFFYSLFQALLDL